MTVSKTTTQEKARKWLQSSYDLACGELWHSWNDSSAADFADTLTAELQKENARLREALQKAKLFIFAAHSAGYEEICRIKTRTVYDTIESALNPPKGGAVQKGLSKEKAK